MSNGQLALPTLPDKHMSHLDSIQSRSDSSIPEPLQAVEPLNNNPTSTSVDSHEQYESMLNSGQSGMTLRSKRRAITEPGSDNWGSQMMASNKRPTPVATNAKGPIVSPSQNKKPTLNTSRTSGSGRKIVQLESPVKKHHSTTFKNNPQPEMSSKGPTESYDSVRAKLRESLTSALALVSEQREGSSDGKMKMEHEGAVHSEGVKEQKPLVETRAGAADVEIVRVEESGTSSIFTDGRNDEKKSSPGAQLKETFGEDPQTWNYMGPEFQSDSILSGEDSLFGDSFFFKDELLQGNGLAWVSDPDPRISELNEFQNNVKSEVLLEEVTIDEKKKTLQSPEALATKIEFELFKLFGGVNKKYKEKGRSLLFNLKDRNNPELRKRVMSGEIPPDRLCSMTAEELASKELSQWRIAKAEELDNMKVLPDSDINMRRLVKKTHKGEYQVDLDTVIDASDEISPIISVPSQKRPKTNGSDPGPPLKPNPTKVESYVQCEITIPSDGADMQGLMVDDVKDLPPIVSLDEFMESLNKEPPFENLPVDSEATTLEKDKENPGNSPPSKQSVSITYQKTVEQCGESKIPYMDKKSGDSDKGVDKKLGDAQKGLGTNIVHLPKQAHVWEGLVQLSISSMANFVALYKSGEKANTREWAGFFDIKGRVRLDAFDKFLQALPMSRSRAIMVSHFILKEGSTESERSGLVELVDSYITDDRLGFAEPAPGVELYLCPPRTKTVDMIINHLPKSYTEKLNDIDDGLIGIVVWRKVQIAPSVISANSSSHQKHQIKDHTKTQITVNDMNRNNVGFTPPPILAKSCVPDEEDDVPPGFGPPGNRDDDDLPEFNFSGVPNQPTSHTNPNSNLGQGLVSQHQNPLQGSASKVDKMRELIQKYGQNGTSGGGIPTEPWNDDDNDIPEWQPQASNTPPPSRASHIAQNQALPSQLPHYQSFQRPTWPLAAHPIQPLQRPMNVKQQGIWLPYGPNGPVGNLPGGQFNGAPPPGHMSRDWRYNNSANNNQNF
ncbi:unnamed protein product [Amaranthus hypochondriacus]